MPHRQDALRCCTAGSGDARPAARRDGRGKRRSSLDGDDCQPCSLVINAMIAYPDQTQRCYRMCDEVFSGAPNTRISGTLRLSRGSVEIQGQLARCVVNRCLATNVHLPGDWGYALPEVMEDDLWPSLHHGQPVAHH